ncbi:pelle [Carabus blaptoides fortunei]
MTKTEIMEKHLERIMDDIVTTKNVYGCVFADHQGLCLGAKGEATTESAGLLVALTEQVAKLEPQSGLPIVVLENDTRSCIEIKRRMAINNLPKYNTEHFKLIENAGCKLRKPCSEILFEEWGTSGRIRPRLGHLLKLLERAELYRAADYVAIELLKLPPPERPLTGPAARVNTFIEENATYKPQNTVAEVRQLLDEISYPSSLLSNTTNVDNMNQNMQPAKLIVPKIVISDVTSNTDNAQVSNDRTLTTRSNNASDHSSEASLIQRGITLERKILRYSPQIPENLTESTEIDSTSSVSDMIQFSSENNLPAITLLNQSTRSDPQEYNSTSSVSDSNGNVPDIDNMLRTSISSNSNNTSSNMPAFSQILDSKNNNSAYVRPDMTPAFSQIMNSETNIRSSSENSENFIPAFSEMQNSDFNMPAMSQILHSENNIPALSKIMNSFESESNSKILNSGNMPHFSRIMHLSGSHENNSELINSDNNVPTLSQIMHSSNLQDNNIPALSQIMHSLASQDNNIPALSQIMHSSDSQDNNIPALSQIMHSSDSQDNNLPALSQIIPSSASETSLSNHSENGIPVFDRLLSNSSEESNQHHISGENVTGNLPAISGLLSNEPAQHTNSNTNSSNLPNITVFQPTEKINSLEITVTRKTSLSPSIPSRTTCASPLPNLSLNTLLPHFTYQELELCTGGFDETVLNSQHSIYDDNEPNGRKLGSGAFGSVYLGTGLLEKPVAVKKLNLNGVNVVNVDDTITKQFRNEVELLCKYKHENLLSLLGYSCDGPTYCLIYEYICGGALKDRLQSTENRLIWTDRLYIALGTARAVSYLHNAHSMPLIHRDIKSANILLDNANKPKLCDFGLIKLTPNQNTNTGTTVFGLPPLDEYREGNDIVTHVEEVCDDDIKPLLDTKAGSWVLSDVHFGDRLYEIAMHCLEEKKRRPVMAEVVVQLSLLIDKADDSL